MFKFKLLALAAVILMAVDLSAQPNLTFKYNQHIISEGISALEFGPGGRYLALGLQRGTVYLLDAQTGTTLSVMPAHRREVSALIFDREGKYLISGSFDKKVKCWNLAEGKIEREFKGYGGRVLALALSLDNQTLAVGGENKEIILYHFPAGTERGRIKGHKKDVIFLAFNRTGDQLLSVGKDNKMIFWDLDRLIPDRNIEVAVQTMKNSGCSVTAAACGEDRQVIAVAVQERALAKGGRDMKFERSVIFYDWENGSQLKVISGNEKDMDFMELTAQTVYLLTDNSTLRENRLAFWDTESGIVDKSFTVGGEITALDISPDGRWVGAAHTISSTGQESFVTVWRAGGLGEGGIEDELWKPDIVKKTITVSNEEPLIRGGKRRTIAVLHFDAVDVDSSLTRSAVDLLESRLAESPRVRLLERKHIDKIIQELNFQKSDLTESQGIEIGKLANAEFILIGSVNKVGTSLHIIAKLVSVSSSETAGIREVECTAASPSEISNMIKALAPTIAAMK
ncbi:MAG: hypothetical protein JXB45_12580 [Candidatus Krumholzibacteriota bacterium]|nr:hypothetical protein [Candidatus Krumholzibacteriota bacterium]